MGGRADEIAGLEGRVVAVVRGVGAVGWRRIDVRCRALVATSDVVVTCLGGDGERWVVPEVPGELSEALLRLRRAQYLSEQGTWFSLVFFVEPDRFGVVYNYDDDPGWEPPLPVEHWRRDQVVLPRDGAKMPRWLRERLDGREPEYAADDVPVPLDPAEQMALLSNRFTTLVADQAPPLWQKVFGYYQAAGGHVEFPPLMVTRADRTRCDWTPPPAAAALLDRLRAGTHAFQGSTWSRIDFEVLYDETSVRCRASYTYDREPAWNTLPSAHEVQRELERFPTAQIPEWMTQLAGEASRRAAEVPPPRPALRRARVFDGIGPDGENPSVTRPPVPPDETGVLAEYLRRCPVVLAARSSAPDLLDAARPDRVPLTFHTDGVWVWSGAVAYYLAEHGVPPEPELVAHVRGRGFRVPALSDDEIEAATAAVTGEKAPDRLAPGSADPAPGPSDTGTAAEDAGRAGRWLERVRQRLEDFGVDPGAYRIGESADGAWCLVGEDGGWAVFKDVGGERLKPVRFEAPDDAAAHLLGRVLLIPARRPSEPSPPVIEPLPGEPPLTLFRDPAPVRVPVGTVVDRYGDPSGNVVYAKGTPFPQRSLPPDWENRPYQAYRVARPAWALRGTAVPWFEQPGGGTAYVLAASVEALVAEGVLEPDG